MAQRKTWNDLSREQRRGVMGLGFVQLALLAVAQWDLARRSDAQVRGPKWMWRLVTLINFVGPISYFLLGREES